MIRPVAIWRPIADNVSQVFVYVCGSLLLVVQIRFGRPNANVGWWRFGVAVGGSGRGVAAVHQLGK
jgi:hypothetical protein